MPGFLFLGVAKGVGGGCTGMSCIARLLFPGCPGCYFNSLPPSLQSPQGAANPIPSRRPRPGGGLVVWRGWGQPAVRVPGQGPGSSLSQTMKHKPGSQGGEGGRAERMCPPGNRRAVFLRLVPEIKWQRGVEAAQRPLLLIH